jgi:imidazolonepropionase-like amidohydrolase
MVRVVVRLVLLSLSALLVVSIDRPMRAQSPTDRVALIGALLIDGNGGAPVPRATVLVENGRVKAIGPSEKVAVPREVTRVDVSGKVIVPGFIGGHQHVKIVLPSRTPEFRQRWVDEAELAMSDREQLIHRLRTFADYGFTTVFSLGEVMHINPAYEAGAGMLEPGNAADMARLWSAEKMVRQLHDEQERGSLDRARIYGTGPRADMGLVKPGVATPTEARANVDRVADIKVDFVKISLGLPGVTPEVEDAVFDEAKKRGLRVATHVGSVANVRDAVDRGAFVIAHLPGDRDYDAGLLADMKRLGVAQMPTLIRTANGLATTEAPFSIANLAPMLTDPFLLRHPALRKQVAGQRDAESLKARGTPAAAVAQETKLRSTKQLMRNLKLASDAGIPIVFGTDGVQFQSQPTFVGYNEHVEFELMVAAGLTPMQALLAATRDAARVLKINESLGTLDPGKWADLVVLNRNPLENIRNTREIDSVWIAGRKITRPLE